MRRADLEHVIRAAAFITGDEIVVIGSQAILGQHPDAPAELLRSQEADLYPRHRPESSDEIDGNIGDLSDFQAVNGYYAHGVAPETAILPGGWEERLVRVDVPVVGAGRLAAVGWCLDTHDVVVAKLAAGRERDWEFAEAALRHELVNPDELERRAWLLPAEPRGRVEAAVRGVAVRSGRRPRSTD